MNTTMIRTLATTLVALSAFAAPLASHAQIRSKSGELVVMGPHNLPEQAQMPGNSFFLHSDNGGSTFLYVEQQDGKRLTVFDVTDPSRIKSVSSTERSVFAITFPSLKAAMMTDREVEGRRSRGEGFRSRAAEMRSILDLPPST